MGLLDMPPEMFERVAQHCDGRELQSLRQVCRDVAAKVLKTYAGYWFSWQDYFVTESHLQQAIKTANHPSLCKSLEYLYLNVAEVGIERWRQPHQPDAAASWMAAPSIPDFIAARQAQEDMRNKEIDLHLLVVLFCTIRRRTPSLRHLGVRTGTDNQKYPGGTTMDNCREPVDGDCRLFMLLIHALALSGLQIEEFYDEVLEIPLRKIMLDDIANENMRIAFSQIKALTLCTDTDPDDEKAEVIGKKFGEALSTLMFLRRLELTHSHRDGGIKTAFSDGLFTAKLPVLGDLTLEYCDVHYHNLINFLARHGKDGELVRFVGVGLGIAGWAGLVDGYDAKKFAKDIQGASKLETVECYEGEF